MRRTRKPSIFFYVAAILLAPKFAATQVPGTADGFDYSVCPPTATPEREDFDGCKLDQGFGENNHLGEDWNGDDGASLDLGQPVYAAANGFVVLSGNEGPDWGPVIIIQHDLPNGGSVSTLYGHLQDRLKEERSVVSKGEQIGTIGEGVFFDESGVSASSYPDQAHLHFELRTDASLGRGSGYSTNNGGWVSPSTYIQDNRDLCNYPGGTVILRPRPKDVWTTSVFSHTSDNIPFPGGGINDQKLVVGGWGDTYISLLEFGLCAAPTTASSAVLRLYNYSSTNGTPVGMFLDRITEEWDWRTQGTGRDLDRLWWIDRPAAEQWRANSLPAPTVGEWYEIDVTDLYNAWKAENDGVENFGLQLRPTSTSRNWNNFYSADYDIGSNCTENDDDCDFRPRLVVEAAPISTMTPSGNRFVGRGSTTDIIITAENVDTCVLIRGSETQVSSWGPDVGSIDNSLTPYTTQPIESSTTYTLACTPVDGVTVIEDKSLRLIVFSIGEI